MKTLNWIAVVVCSVAAALNFVSGNQAVAWAMVAVACANLTFAVS